MDTRLLTRLGTLRQVEIFMRVAETGSIARAAESLHLAQPSVSNQVKKLSEALDIPLYEVIGKQVHLTEAGQQVVRTGQELFESIQRLDENLNNIKGLTAGTLRIAVVSTAKYFMPHILGPFCREYPDIDVEFKVGNRAQIIERLKGNRDDLYLFDDPPQELAIRRHQFLPNPLAVIASSENPLGRRGPLEWADIANEKFLVREAGSGTQNAVEQHLRQHGWAIGKHITIASNEAIKYSVMADMGIAILSAYVLANAQEDGLMQLPVRTFPIMSHWYVVHLQQKTLSLVADRFLEFVLNRRQDLLPMKKIEAHIANAYGGSPGHS
ncbi:LysR family transcriptional regulator [Pseudohalioglobus sediminis]|uniref:LysR family transcriptional regulator n=1 Tax=Pseudohalioglobus sediminis TaxID=2606449 RepID=A0A5B0WPB9_9GAMM|nr:LysR family transcriptional regulator [Pseudohalioglobus sediminis]KAA1188900.1 LysR family transcriptional regulator [Pseudohalioglobus sediminis]